MRPRKRRVLVLEGDLVELLVLFVRDVLGVAHPERCDVVDALPLGLDDGPGLDGLVLLLDLDLVVVGALGDRNGLVVGLDRLLDGLLGPKEDRRRSVLGVATDQSAELLSFEELFRVFLEPAVIEEASAKGSQRRAVDVGLTA